MHDDIQILELIGEDKSFEKGFELLVKQFQEPLYWHIRRIVHFHEDADDILQNVFIKVFKNIKGFKQNSKLYTWLYRIATNETLSYIQKNKKKINSSADLVTLEESLKADRYFDPEDIKLRLSLAIASLPEKQRLVFNMRYFEEMSYKNISEILETSIGALKASYHHAIKKVENHLKQNLDYVG